MQGIKSPKYIFIYIISSTKIVYNIVYHISVSSEITSTIKPVIESYQQRQQQQKHKKIDRGRKTLYS